MRKARAVKWEVWGIEHTRDGKRVLFTSPAPMTCDFEWCSSQAHAVQAAAHYTRTIGLRGAKAVRVTITATVQEPL